jgi:hypothetical protein
MAIVRDSKVKKTIAREVLLFFSVVVLVALVWLFLIGLNYYYSTKSSSSEKKRNFINAQLDSLPSDRIKSLYEGIRSVLVTHYLVKEDTFVVAKKFEEEFLNSHPNAKRLPASSKGYSRPQTIEYDFPLLNKDGLPVPNKDALPILNNDHTFVFDFVELSDFRIFLHDSSYRSELYLTVSKDYDVGSRQSYESKIGEGFKFDDEIYKRQQTLLLEKGAIERAVNSYNSNIKGSSEIWKITLWTFLVLLIIMYPLRFCVRLLTWSVKTIREPNT